MKILHLCLSNFYIDGYNYQENVLPRINMLDGHEVKIIASTETYIDNYTLGYIEPNEYINEDGIQVKRIPYKKIINTLFTTKIRKYKNLYDEIELFQPDIIMSHDLAFLSVLDVVRYVENHKNVKFYADTHTNADNSGTNWISLNILHRWFYKKLIKKAEPLLDAYFYIGKGEKDFSIKNYKMNPEKMEFLPLGGVIFEDDVYNRKRQNYREKLGIKNDEILLLHTGKLTELKRTEELIRAFSAVPELNAKLAIIGSISEERKEKILALVDTDSRITYLGWKQSTELIDYLCACDLYCQPGSGSATFQNAICCNCPVLSYIHESYKDYDYGNIIWIDTEKDIENALRKIEEGSINLSEMSKNSEICAKELLDYRALARKIYT